MGITFAASSKSADAPDIEPGVYPADFNGVRADTIENSQYGNGDIFSWEFTVFDQGDPVEVRGTTSRSLNTKSKTTPTAVRWLKSLLNKAEWAKFEAGDGLDADELVGRRCQVQVEIKDSGWPKIVNVLPAAK